MKEKQPSLNACCFLGHRHLKKTDELKHKLNNIIENLILNENVSIFLFGSKSRFDDLCHEIVTDFKSKYPHIKRIYVRAEFPYIDEDYKSFLLNFYEDTYYPENIINSGKAVYFERNCEMIDKSVFCVVYYDENYLPPKRKNSRKDFTDYQPKSGTKIAYEYAKRTNKKIILL